MSSIKEDGIKERNTIRPLLVVVVVREMSAEQKKFRRAPIVTVHYKKWETPKRLLGQRWTGHVAAEQVTSKSHEGRLPAADGTLSHARCCNFKAQRQIYCASDGQDPDTS